MSTALRQAAHRHRHLLFSVAGHALILSALFAFGTFEIRQAERARDMEQVGASEQELRRIQMERNVDTMSAIKKEMEREAVKAGNKDDVPGEARPAAEAPGKRSPEELRVEAERLAESMRQLEQARKADELASLMKISKDEALEKISAEEKAAAQMHSPPKGDDVDAIASLVQQASDMLNRLRRDKDAQENGVRVADDGHHGAGGKGKSAAGGSGSFNILAHGSGSILGQAPAGRVYKGYRPQLSMETGNMHQASGRTLGAGGKYATRFIPDSWHIIGPFPSSYSTGINSRFPPEILVDLEAAYIGMDGDIVKWEYVNSDSYPIVPPHPSSDAIWYGYTELNFDQARDATIAFGADDDCVVWLDNQLVGVSGDEMKRWYIPGAYEALPDDIEAWNLNEAVRRVHFNKGKNRILFKLYNGPGPTFFSFVVIN